MSSDRASGTRCGNSGANGRRETPGLIEARRRIAVYATGTVESFDLGVARIDPAAGVLSLASLGLDSFQLAMLADNLVAQESLRDLRLDHNSLTSEPSIADALGRLRNLTDLYLHNNQLTSEQPLADALGRLRGLTNLWLNHNKLTSAQPLADAIGSLTNLTQLYLHDNQLDSKQPIASALSPLKELKTLWISNNKLTSEVYFAESLALLEKLTILDLSNNRLKSTEYLARALGPLTKLTMLWLNNNQLTSEQPFAEAISPLENLTQLWLDNNQLTPDKPLADALVPLVKVTALWRNGNPLNLSESVCQGRDPRQLLRALADIIVGRSVPCPEFKLVFLGQGRAGKTSLWRRLLGASFRNPEPPTHSFEWRALPKESRPAWPPGLAEIIVPGKDGEVFKLGTPSAAVYLFDFGGQHALWASHRFFVSSRHAVFVVVVSRGHTLHDSRLEYWLRYIEHIWKETRESWALQEVLRSVRSGKPESDELRAEADEAALSKFPKPLVLVVLTNRNKKALDVAQVRTICADRSVELIEDYDNDDKNADQDGSKLAAVREKLREIMQAESQRRIWTDLHQSYIIDRRTKCRQEFGFGEEGFSENPRRRWIDLERFYAEICGLNAPGLGGPDAELAQKREDARADLGVLRDFGVVHWVGDHPDLARSNDKVCDLIFSPAAVRRPVYNVLWAEHPAREPFTHTQILTEIRRVSPDDRDREPISEKDAALILQLMIECQLVFEVPDRKAPPGSLYLVPDRFPAGELTIPDDTPLNDSETLFRADLGFVPDMLMPRLIGQLWVNFACEAVTRCSCTVLWTIGAHTYPVRLCCDQATGVMRVGIGSAEPSVVWQIKGSVEIEIRKLLRRAAGDVNLIASGGVLTAQRDRVAERETLHALTELKSKIESLSGSVGNIKAGVVSDLIARLQTLEVAGASGWSRAAESQLDALRVEISALLSEMRRRQGQFLPKHTTERPAPILDEDDRRHLTLTEAYLQQYLKRAWKPGYADRLKEAFEASCVSAGNIKRKAWQQPHYYRLMVALAIANTETRIPNPGEEQFYHTKFNVILSKLWQCLTDQENTSPDWDALRHGYPKAWAKIHGGVVLDRKAPPNIESKDDL